ncbi:16S rRNA (adenine(1518)-N(6)/adenine(1519)-N(6))-dimethyltransferase RsmA [Candidatus Palauibacter sp.]|uniref:16S rRNA (adenine(1518)-N(6)/adenine(1519)-N(6))- dimethyltransferase RsmA n=1 Tax=Candidatus Palauibacter sp. TaxID=3101350 RepID=UPI003B012553
MTDGEGPRSRPKRSLGQHFLVDPNIQRKIVAELDPGPEDYVLEVGPGHGELSRHLRGRCRGLVLIEKDRELAASLRARWGDRPGVDILEADALRLDLSTCVPPGAPVRVVSNVPYNITSPLVFAFLELDPAAVRAVITVQREVADRIVAAPGTKVYGALSVGIQAVAEASLVFRVGRQAFRPVPAVDSAVVRLEPRPDAAGVDREGLRTLTRACFNRRRKQLQKTLRTAPELGFSGDPRALLTSLSINPAARPEVLDPDQFVALAARLRALEESDTAPRE